MTVKKSTELGSLSLIFFFLGGGVAGLRLPLLTVKGKTEFLHDSGINLPLVPSPQVGNVARNVP